MVPEEVQKYLNIDDEQFLELRENLPGIINGGLPTPKWEKAFGMAKMMLESEPELEPTSALKQAGSDAGIPYGDAMGEFVEWANSCWS